MTCSRRLDRGGGFFFANFLAEMLQSDRDCYNFV
jgi:hypothetical protein